MKNLLRLCVTGIFFGALLVCTQVQAQEFRFGFVKTERIFKEANAAKTAQTSLEQEFSQREKEIASQDAGLKAAVEKFQIEAVTLSDAQRSSRQKQLGDQDRDLQRKRRSFQEDLNARKNEEMQQLIDRVNVVVKQVAEAEKYDLVLQEAVYVDRKHDLTDKILSIMNARSEK
jgi:outer membrane protein